MTLNQLEAIAIEKALEQNSYNLTQTCKSLGVSMPTLYRKMREYGINTKAYGVGNYRDPES